MSLKGKRKTRLGSTAAASARTAANKERKSTGTGRKGALVAKRDHLDYMKAMKHNRWPTQHSLHLYGELNMIKRPRQQRRKGIKPGQSNDGFMILETLIGNCPKTLDKLLTAASLKIKRVRRYPGIILTRTYNLKNRPITIL